MKRICFAGLMLTSVLLSARPKLVTLGKSPDPTLLRSNIDLVEKSCPFDGITIELPGSSKTASWMSLSGMKCSSRGRWIKTG